MIIIFLKSLTVFFWFLAGCFYLLASRYDAGNLFLAMLHFCVAAMFVFLAFQ